jgi:glycosyltransferase involved in cell wall biosynthesis
MPKVILISQFPLPYHGIGSWTTLYDNYLESNHHCIDAILCEKSQTMYPHIEYINVSTAITSKLIKKIRKNPQHEYIETLVSYLKAHQKYIIQIIDNFGFAKALHDYVLEKPELKGSIYIQFFYHGYPPFYGNFESRWFFEFIDEMVLLTYASYYEHKRGYTNLPCLFSILHNGIDTSKFFKVSSERKQELKTKYNVSNKTVFLWCSQDRPKKGLDLLLYVWKEILKKHQDIELWVIGTERDLDIDHVRFFGKIPNAKLPEYYQTSDCYVFPTLCHEGFGLTLIEALYCGNHCIASALGGVPEVLQNGKLGVLIENPHFIQEWVAAIDNFLKDSDHKALEVPQDLYTKAQWVQNMNRIIGDAKNRIE